MADATVALFFTHGIVAGSIGLMLTGVAIWARVKIKAHTAQEAILGFLFGGIITLVAFKLYLQL